MRVMFRALSIVAIFALLGVASAVAVESEGEGGPCKEAMTIDGEYWTLTSRTISELRCVGFPPVQTCRTLSLGIYMNEGGMSADFNCSFGQWE